MIKLTLLDGSVKEIESAQSAAEIIKSIGMGLYKAACCVKINGEVKDLRTVIDSDCEFEVCTFDTIEGKKTFWHTASHILAQAVKRLYPQAKLAIGPAIDNGFYYDFDLEKPFTPDELEKIEAEMKAIVKEGIALEQFELSPDEAIKMLKDMNEPYKVELCEEHAGKGEPISFYKQGDFTDLCAGPHLMTTAPVKAFKLISCTGAYWRGSEKNQMLSRVYATAYPKAADLEADLKQREEAKLRDHNKLGRELEFFTTVDYIGQGLPVMLPKGARVIQLLQRWVEDTEQKHGYLLTKTPLVAKRELYKISGHWDHYLDGMFVLGDPNDETKECFALRPMTCPFQYQVYLNRQRSYRDLPMRLGETSTLFRNEDSGEMHGLIRVRQFTISEGHLVLRPEQLEEEFKDCLELAKYMLETVGLLEDCTFRFSQWDPANPKNKYEGTPEQWETAQAIMAKILDNLGVEISGVSNDRSGFDISKLAWAEHNKDHASILVLSTSKTDEKDFPQSYTYIACGGDHHHAVKRGGSLVNSGSPEPLSAADTGRHGYYIGEIDTAERKITSLKFVTLPTVRYITLVVNVTPVSTRDDVLNNLTKEIESRGTDNIYRIRLNGLSNPEVTFNLEELENTYRIDEVCDLTRPDYDYVKLFREHPSDMVGFFVKEMNREDISELDRKALTYGVTALLKTADERS